MIFNSDVYTSHLLPVFFCFSRRMLAQVLFDFNVQICFNIPGRDADKYGVSLSLMLLQNETLEL